MIFIFFFFLSLIFWELINNQTILALDYLKSYKLQDKFFSKNFDRFSRKVRFKEKDTYVKDDKFNLKVVINAINSIVSCEALGLKESFLGTCYGHF